MCVAFVVVLLVAVIARAQQAPAGPPKPGPEHKRLAMFAGKWTSSGEMKDGPWGPGGRTSGDEKCEWFEGGFALACHSQGSGPMGKVKAMYFLTYKPEEKVYVYTYISSIGEFETSAGTVQGKVWTWRGESKMGGKTLKNRFVLTEESNDAYHYTGDFSEDGGKTWKPMMSGKSTRAR
jgi:hypothetical protein